MGKTMNCPYCYNNDTLRVVYSYRGYTKRNNDDVSHLLKNGTIYRDEKCRYKKYDFDGEEITAVHYNKYCPNCKRYFYSIGKLATIDIKMITIIYNINYKRYRFDFYFHENKTASYSGKLNYVLIKNRELTSDERFNILKDIKNSKIKFWDKETGVSTEYNTYSWIIKVTYNNELSNCYYGYDKISNFWNDLFKNIKKIIAEVDLWNDFNELK